jgi:DNA modification methylase
MQRESLLNVDILKVVPYFRNPRKNQKAVPKVVESIKKFGYVKTSICIDEDDVLLCGHTTLAALKSLELILIPEVTRITGLTKAQKLGYRIADNKTGEYAEWDEKLLMENYDEMKLLDGDSFDFTATGYSAKEISRIRDAIFPPTAKGDNFEIRKVETTIKRGDIFKLGSHVVMCGDSTLPDDTEKLYGQEIAAIVFTSPPYNAGEEYWLNTGESKYEGDDDEMDWRDYSQFLSDFTRNHISRCCYLFINIQMLRANKLALIDFMHTFMFNIADIIIWDKETAQPAMAENILNSQFEFILVLKEEVPANRKVGTKNFRGTISNVYKGSPQRTNDYSGVHSATFPMHLPEWVIGNFTQEGEVVFDPFLGTGTSLIACEQMGRVLYGMELSPQFLELSIQRWEKLTGKVRTCS